MFVQNFKFLRFQIKQDFSNFKDLSYNDAQMKCIERWLKF